MLCSQDSLVLTILNTDGETLVTFNTTAVRLRQLLQLDGRPPKSALILRILTRPIESFDL